MGDWPALALQPNSVVINSHASPASFLGDICIKTNSLSTTWTTANLAVYMPFAIETTQTAYQMATENGATVAGNVDVGIYDELGNRLVSMGSTAMAGASVLQVFNIADTVLTPGTYWMALNCDATTATFFGFNTSPVSAQVLQTCGMQEQAVGAVTLPNPATFANQSRASFPSLSVFLTSTTI